jgi:hypothetical protein
MQESVLSQRKLIVTDNYLRWWCKHTDSAEDRNCRHKIWPVGDEFEMMYFYNTDNSDLIPAIRTTSNFDTYSYMVADYTRRNMTKQQDGENAMRGILGYIEFLFVGDFVQGLPESEFDSALLWCPIGPLRRRVEEITGTPLFPSWSWLGWIGPVSYPWSAERQFPLTSLGSGVKWRDGRTTNGTEFATTDQEALRAKWSRLKEDPWCWQNSHEPDQPYHNPRNLRQVRPFVDFDHENQHRIGINTMSALFHLSTVPLQRREKYNDKYTINYMHVLDYHGFSVGLIYIPLPDPSAESHPALLPGYSKPLEFIILSRASIDKDPRIGYDEVAAEGEMAPEANPTSSMHREVNTQNDDPSDFSFVHDKGKFDTRVYDENISYCMFNVMMIEWDEKKEVACRIAVGRIHIHAFVSAEPVRKLVWLE